MPRGHVQTMRPLRFLFITSVLLINNGRTLASCPDVELKEIPENATIGSVLYSGNVDDLTVISIKPPSPGLVQSKCSDGKCSLTLKSTVDAERQRIYTITLRLRCNQEVEITDLTLFITDIDDNPVTFSHNSSSIQLSEGTNEGTVIFNFMKDNKAMDNDRTNNQVIYNIVNGGGDYFEMNNVQLGEIGLLKKLDYESGPTRFELNVSAKTQSKPDGKAAFSILYINVTDVDDMNPVFTENVYTVNFPEGNYTTSACFPTSVSAVDGDRGIDTPVEIELDASSKALYPSFSFNDDNNTLCVNGVMDKRSYSLNIKAFQTDDPTFRSALSILNVFVTDVNNNPPVMKEASYNASISEGISLNTIVLMVSATDGDDNKNGIFAFHLLCDSSISCNDFRIETIGQQGLIFPEHKLDREKKKVYNLQVYAKETKTTEKKESAKSSVTIFLLDENDNNPSFQYPPYTFYLQRNDPVETVLGKVAADDPDLEENGNVTYKLQKPSKLFEINPLSGEIQTIKKFTLQDVGAHKLTVIAMDNPIDESKRRSTEMLVTIQVQAVNEFEPKFVDPDPFNLVKEDENPDYFIGQVSATDPDGDSVNYTIISGNTQGYVRIYSGNGKLFLNKTPDLDIVDAPSNLSLSIKASDGIHQTSITIPVNFQFVNEFSPEFSPISIVTVFENATQNTYIATVNATDKDKGTGSKIIYSLLKSQASNYFKIDDESGAITLNCLSCLKHDSNRNFDLAIKAEDDGDPPRVSYTTLSIKVMKTEFAEPYFVETKFTFSIQENNLLGFLGKVHATDPDTPENELIYKLDSFSDSITEWISMTQDGTILAKKSFDAENWTQLMFNVSVSDGHSFDKAEVLIEVKDINDNSPEIVLQPTQIEIPENASHAFFVSKVSAEDKDVTNNGFTFWLGEGSDGKFLLKQVNVSSSFIIASGRFDMKVKQNYSIPVFVSDHGQPPCIANQTLEVRIVDSNSAPEFNAPEYNFTIFENSSIGHVLGHVEANDSDFGSSHRINYIIESGNKESFFSLDRISGILILSKRLNYEQQSNYALTVMAKDQSYIPKAATSRVTINVIDVPEPPQWLSHQPQVFLTQSSACPNVSFDQDFFNEVTRLSAFGDEGVEYYLCNMTEFFSLNVSSGLLLSKTTLPAGTYVSCLEACNHNRELCSPSYLTITVHFDDVLAFCPAFYQIYVKESETLGFEVWNFTINVPKESVTFEMTEGDDSKFQLGSKTGVLKLASELDREKVSSYVLRISAKALNSEQLAEAQVLIIVQDTNDNNPTFASHYYEGEIHENVPIGTSVLEKKSNHFLNVSASDQDEHSQISLRIDSESDNSNGTFMIHQNGTITLLRDIDFEQIAVDMKGVYIFKVIASDGVNNASTTIRVTVRDVNDRIPTFKASTFNVSIPEDQSAPSSILTLTATDDDGLDFSRMKYSLEMLDPSDAMNPFTIGLDTGLIVMQRQLDRELVSSYTLRVNATDTAGHMTTTELTVNVTDVNDNNPKFEKNVYFINVNEGSTGAEKILKVTDDDEGENAQLHFNITSPQDDSTFKLDSGENEVTLKQTKPLDRESNGNVDEIFIMEVTAFDNGNPPLNGSCTVVITIVDVNDHTPTFSPATYEGNVAENAENNSYVLQVDAEDEDGSKFGRPSIRFSLSEENSNLPFRIDAITGELFLCFNNQTLDFETQQEYVFNITATDNSGKGKQSSTICRIFIKDVNDVAPQFTKENYNFTIAENSKLGTYIGTVNATDPDEIGNIFYYIEGHAPFNINSSNGHLTLIGQLYGNGQKIYILKVFATDTIHVTGTSATIKIIACPSWNQSSLLIKVEETASVGEKIGHLQTTDFESSTTYYTNDTDGQGVFNISKAGDIYLGQKLDADKENSRPYVIDVFAKYDGNPPCLLKGEIQITVEAKNDNDPEICYQNECGVKRIMLSVLDKSNHGAVIGMIKSRDNDTGKYGETSFHLQGPSEILEYFNINEEGTLTLAKALNLSEIMAASSSAYSSLSFTVNVTDGGDIPKSSSAEVNVTIVPTTSNILLFVRNLYTMNVIEQQSEGEFVGRVKAVSESGAQGKYSLLNESSLSLPFKIDADNGVIVTTASLDRENQDRYQFIVVARQETNTYHALSLVKVNVTDINDNDPSFDENDLTWHVKENQFPKEPLRVHAFDSDEGENGTVTYSLLNETQFFAINESTGLVSLNEELDRESTSRFYLTVKASDGGSPPKTSTSKITVVVDDVNDETPAFHPSSEYERTILMNTPPQTMIIQVNATDSDSENNGLILYSLVASEIPFIINQFTGEILNVGQLEAKTYSFQVNATDLGNDPLSSIANVSVTVMEKNITEEEIDFFLSNDTLTLFVGMESGLNISTLGLTITSENVQAIKISDGNEKDIFSLNDGHLFLEKPLTEIALYKLELKTGNISQISVRKELEVKVLPLQFFQPLYALEINENGPAPQSILNLSTLPEAFGIPVTYFLSKTYDHFEVQPFPGELILTKPLDREQRVIYDLTVYMKLNIEKINSGERRRRDTNSDFKVAMAKVLVKVKDVNDNAPSFGVNGSKLMFTIPRNVQSGYLITTLKAFDADEGVNQEIVYTIMGMDVETPALKIGKKSGKLQVDSPDELYKFHHLSITVKASNGDAHAGEELQIEINIQNESHESHLVASISLSEFKENQVMIMRNLSTILGYPLTLLSAKLYDKDSIVFTESTELIFQAFDQENGTQISSDTLESLIKERQARIAALFNSFKKPHQKTNSIHDETAAIALITVASVMFLVSFIAIYIVASLWKKQKEYQKREQTAHKARLNMDKDKDTESVDINSDPDEHLELDLDLDDSSIFESKFYPKQTKDFHTMMSCSRGTSPHIQQEWETTPGNGFVLSSLESTDIEPKEPRPYVSISENNQRSADTEDIATDQILSIYPILSTESVEIEMEESRSSYMTLKNNTSSTDTEDNATDRKDSGLTVSSDENVEIDRTETSSQTCQQFVNENFTEPGNEQEEKSLESLSDNSFISQAGELEENGLKEGIGCDNNDEETFLSTSF